MKNNKKIVVYARTASKKQNIDLQLEAAKSHLKGVQEEKIVTLTDEATSISSHRKGLQTLLELVKNDQVDTLIVYQQDRLTRSAHEYLEIMDLIYKHKVKVIFTGNEDIPFQHDQEKTYMSNRMKAFLKVR